MSDSLGSPVETSKYQSTITILPSLDNPLFGNNSGGSNNQTVVDNTIDWANDNKLIVIGGSLFIALLLSSS
jgi:hypothetical protein